MYWKVPIKNSKLPNKHSNFVFHFCSQWFLQSSKQWPRGWWFNGIAHVLNLKISKRFWVQIHWCANESLTNIKLNLRVPMGCWFRSPIVFPKTKKIFQMMSLNEPINCSHHSFPSLHYFTPKKLKYFNMKIIVK